MSEHDPRNTTSKSATAPSSEEVEALVANPTPEALATLHDTYGLIIGADGHLYRTKGRVNVTEEAREAGENAAEKIGSALHTAGEVVMANVIDAPIVAMQRRKANYRQNRAERLAARAERKQRREQAREEEQREKEAAKAAADAAIASERAKGHTTGGHTTAS